MPEWTIRDYLTARGTNEIRAWIASLPDSAQAKIDYILLLLRGSRNWPPQYVSALVRWDDIYEIRAGSRGVQYRPLGCYGPDRREFTLLIGAIEKGGKLPRPALEAAVQRRRIIMADKERTCEHRFRQTRNL
jgi:hypothetical protein